MCFRVQPEKVCIEIVYRDVGGDDRRGCTEIRPVDGVSGRTVDRAADVSPAAIVLR